MNFKVLLLLTNIRLNFSYLISRLYLACTLHDQKDQITFVQDNYSVHPNLALKYYKKMELEQIKMDMKTILNGNFNFNSTFSRHLF
jgi:hypothetical protein